MEIKWYGHSAFRITTIGGERIIIDPYEPDAFGGAIAYGAIKDEADIVLTTHDHADHNYTQGITGKFKHIQSAGQYEEKGVKIRAIETFHDKSEGKERGTNLVFVLEADGLVVAHLGDLGEALESNLLKAIGKVDVLLLPVGGFFTIDAEEATKVMNDLGPAITIPMHYKTEKINLPIEALDAFTKDKQNVRKVSIAEVVITKAMLPKISEIVVLKHAL